MILAGHRFGKSGQKKHASRAYQLALQVEFCFKKIKNAFASLAMDY